MRIGTAEIYRQVEQLPEVLESVAVGQEIDGGAPGDVRIVLFVKLQPGATLDQDLRDKIVNQLRENTTPLHVPKKIIHPFANVDPQIDPKMRRAATIAEERAKAHSLSKCWHFVKEALVAAGAVKSRPQTSLAKQAGQELVKNYGFKKLPVSNPYEAPVGSVLVYDAKRAAGHVEIRTETGFVSDFRSKTPSRRPLIGVFTKT